MSDEAAKTHGTGAEQTAPASFDAPAVDEARPDTGVASPPAPSIPWGAHAAAALRHTGRAARTVATTLTERRGLRTVLLGGLVLLVAVSLGGAFELPLLAVGLVMLVIGAMGPRLGGHLDLDFGPEGTAITFQAQIAPPGRRLQPGAVVTAPEAAEPPREAGRTLREERRSETASERLPLRADIDSTGETMEIDAHDLRARLDAEPVMRDRSTR